MLLPFQIELEGFGFGQAAFVVTVRPRRTVVERTVAGRVQLAVGVVRVGDRVRARGGRHRRHAVAYVIAERRAVGRARAQRSRMCSAMGPSTKPRRVGAAFTFVMMSSSRLIEFHQKNQES